MSLIGNSNNNNNVSGGFRFGHLSNEDNETLGSNWRRFVKWLLQCKHLPANHPLFAAQASETLLNNMLKDGVFLCHLAKQVLPNSIPRILDTRNSESSCVRNIEAFLEACASCFHLKISFQPEDLLYGKNFPQVLRTLSAFSRCRSAENKFGETGWQFNETDGQASIHNGSTNVVEGEDFEDYYHTAVQITNPEDEEEIYQTYVAASALERRESVAELPRYMQVFHEFKETEENFVSTLSIFCEDVVLKSKDILSDSDHRTIFTNIQEIATCHTEFLTELKQVYRGYKRFSGQSTLEQLMFRYKEPLCVHAEYVIKLDRARIAYQNLSPKLKERMMQLITTSRLTKQFPLNETLALPFQRITRLRLLLGSMKKDVLKYVKEQPDKEAEVVAADVCRADDIAANIVSYINEAKRDDEARERLVSLEESFQGMDFPAGSKGLRDYGRLLQDGDVRLHSVTQPQNADIPAIIQLYCSGAHKTVTPTGSMVEAGKKRFLFLFQRLFLIMKAQKHATFVFQRFAKFVTSAEIGMLVDLYDRGRPAADSTTTPRIPDVIRSDSAKLAKLQSTFYLKLFESAPELTINAIRTARQTRVGGVVYDPDEAMEAMYFIACRSPEAARSWVVKMHEAQQMCVPKHSGAGFHDFKLFEPPHKTSCDRCQLLLCGTLLQGYRCHKCKLLVHEACMNEQSDDPRKSIICPNAFPNYAPLQEYDWFHGLIPKEQAARRVCEKHIDGTFLVRVSMTPSNEGNLALTVFKRPDAHHARIYCFDSRYSLVATTTFASVVDLVNYYEKHSLSTAFQNPLDTTLTMAAPRGRGSSMRRTSLGGTASLTPSMSRAMAVGGGGGGSLGREARVATLCQAYEAREPGELTAPAGSRVRVDFAASAVPPGMALVEMFSAELGTNTRGLLPISLLKIK